MNKIKNIQKEIGAEYWKEVDSTNFIKLYKLYKATLLDIQGQHRLQNKLKYRDNILVERFAQTVGLLQTEDGSSLCQEWKHGCILGTCWTAVEWNWNLPRSSLQKPAMVTKQLNKKIHEWNQITCTGWLLKWLDSRKIFWSNQYKWLLRIFVSYYFELLVSVLTRQFQYVLSIAISYTYFTAELSPIAAL